MLTPRKPSAALPLVVFALIAAKAWAGVVAYGPQDPSDTIKMLQAKADLIVVAEMPKDVISMGSAPLDPRMTYPRLYYPTISVKQVLCGTPPDTKDLKVELARIERGIDPPSFSFGQDYIFLLKKPAGQDGYWKSADILLGLLPYERGMAAALSGKLD